MAEIVITDDERVRVEEICSRLDPATHELTRSFIAELEDEEERAFVVDRFRAFMRGDLMGSLIFKAVLASAVELGAVGGTTEIGAMLLDDGDTQDMLLDELRTSRRPRTMSNGKLSWGARRWLWGLGYMGASDFTVNVILQQVNQGKARPVGAAQEALDALRDMALFEMFPEWSALLAEEAIEMANLEEEDV